MSEHRLWSKALLSSVVLVVGCVGGADIGSQVDGSPGAQGDNSPGVIYLTGSLPDLVESTVGDPPTSAVLGQTFTATDTVTNQGSADAGATYTKYYLSATGTTPQYLLGNRSVGAITAGNTDSGSAMVTVPGGVPAGSYHMVACADSGPGTGGRVSQVTESNENNNCTASTGSVVISGPDLIESNVSVSPSMLDLTSNALKVTDTVSNIGSAPAGASITRWLLSTDTVRNSGDGFIRNCTEGGPTPGRNVGTISGGGSSSGQASAFPLCVRDAAGLHSPATGTYYVIACADSTNLVGELNESNNCVASSNTVQIVGGPDLIESAVSDPPSTGTVGTAFPITDTVQNIGGDPASSSYTKFYLSTNGTTLNVYLNTRSVGALAASGTDTATTTMTVPAGTPGGAYHVVACADSGPGTGGRMSQIAETNEKNNCTASAGTINLAAPDLVISAIDDPPPSGAPGSTFPITSTTGNIGTGDAGAFYNKYYLSSNGKTPVYLLAPGVAQSPLTAGNTESAATTGTIPSNAATGMYWLIGCADAGPGIGARASQVVESNENNNCTQSATQIMVP